MIKVRKTWPRQPFIGIALAAGLGISIADLFPHSLGGMIVAAVCATVAFLSRGSFPTYCFVAASFFSLHSIQRTEAPGLLLAEELGPEKQAISARGVVVSEPQVSAGGTASFRFQLRTIERGGLRKWGKATILARWRADVRYGDELQLFGVAQPTDPPRNPGEFDMRSYLARRDVRNVLIVRYPENGRILSRGGGSKIMRAAHASRRWMDAALARGIEDSPEEHGLVSGIALGLREQTADEVEEQFQQTGTIHLFAVAGLHVGMVAYLLWMIARALRLPRKVAICLIIPGLFFYAAITGLNTSSVRAALMAGVLLGGALLDRKVVLGNSLAAAAVLLLCFDTQELFTTGFQLSFAVVTTIIVLAHPAFNMLIRWFESDPFLPKSLLNPVTRFGQHLWRMIARGISVSLASWIGSIPLIIPYFYLVTPVSLFANVVVVPIAFFVLAVAMLSLLAFPFAPWLALIFNHANRSLAAAILWIVSMFARAPAGHVYVEPPHLPSGARVEMTALDVGAGAAFHVRNGRVDWLIDSGAERDFKRIVSSYLRSRGINSLDGLILTHGDSAHIGGAGALARVFRPHEIIDTALPDHSASHRKLTAQFHEQKAHLKFASSPDEFPFGNGVVARVLFPPADFRASTADDQALVLQLIVRDHWRVLLMSDSGEATERWLLDSGADVRSDILVKGQHHTGFSGSREFLACVQPEVIVASGVEFPENERIKDDWAAGVGERGIKLLRQDQAGAVTLRFFRDRWEAIPYLRSATVRSTRR